MITLTTASQINSVLGGSVPVNYDKLVLSPMNHDPVIGRVAANLRLSSTTNPSMQTFLGDMTITLSTGEMVVQIPAMPFYRRVILTAGQIASVQGFIDSAQANLENGLISLGIVQGTRAAGV